MQSQSDLSIGKTGAPNPVIAGSPLVYAHGEQRRSVSTRRGWWWWTPCRRA
ncbi:MAG: hypothetical protein IPJ58_13175 [Ardenticatenia bacterium]|nr:hypothetical protein [Ardenticatenia bacterium]